MIRTLAVALLLMLVTGARGENADTPIPADSIYQLAASFSDQQGREFKLADRRGKPQLVAMFYTSCQYVCPLIIDSAKGVEHALTEKQRSGLEILLVSIDPVRDDTQALRHVFDKRKLDAAHWTLARTDEASVRMLAALLGVRYRALVDGEFNHTSAMFLLDSDGRKLASSAKLGSVPDAEFLASVRASLAAAEHKPK